MLHALRTALAALALTGLALAQDVPANDPAAVARGFQEAVLRGDRDAALEALRERAELTPARRALLEAATLAPAERAEAMLRVAAIWAADGAVRGAALLAGAAALATVTGHAPPGTTDEEVSAPLPAEFDVPALLRRYDDALARWTAAGGDTTEARALSNRAAVAGVGSPVRVASGGHIPVPAPTARALAIRLVPAAPGVDPVDAIAAADDTEPAGVAVAAGSYGAEVPVPAPGSWVLEVRDTVTGWRHARRVLVSDLDVVAQSWPGRLAVLATLAGAPAAGARCSLHDADGEVREVVADTDGLALFEVDDLSGSRLVVESGAHRADVNPSAIAMATALPSHAVAHVLVDRPLYRPGDRVQGRAVIRRVDAAAGDAIDEAPLGAQHVRLRFLLGRDRELEETATTDGHGAATFAVRLPDDCAAGRVLVTAELADAPDDLRDPKRPDAAVVLARRVLFEVTDFRRPPILLSLHAPSWASRDESIELVVHGEWAAGGAAADLPVTVSLAALGLSQIVDARLGADGALRIPLALAELPLPPESFRVDVSATVTAPDGQRIDAEARVRVRAAAERPEPTEPARGHAARLTVAGRPERAGEPVLVTIEGAPGAHVLLGIASRRFREARSLVLDADGRATTTVETTAADHPTLRLVATSAAFTPDDSRWPRETTSRTLDVAVPRAAGPVSARVEIAPRLRPGARAELGVRATRDGAPLVGATVAVTVVDETLFALARDATPDPREDLLPRVAPADWRAELAPAPTGRFAVLGTLLANGELTAPEAAFSSNQWNSAVGLGGGAGGRYGGRSTAAAIETGAAPRTEFRATAAFVGALTTGVDGIARATFDLPDDLTTWRITAIVVADDGEACRTRGSTTTELPLSATAVLPRVLRDGDRVDALATARRATPEAIDGQLAMEVTGGPVTIAGPAARPVRFAAGERVAEPVTLLARGTGDARIRTAATAADGTADAEERTLPVLPDEVATPIAVTVSVDGPTDAALPASGAGPVQDVRVRLLGNRDAMLAEAARWLGAYPYGCAEQTVSQLVPAFVGVAAAHARGERPDPRLGLRIEAGMARLRALQIAPGEGFRWWHGCDLDLDMTAIVLDALADGRALGVEPRSHGLDVDVERGSVAAALDRVLAGAGSGDAERDRADAELATAALRFAPGSARARRALEALLDREGPLPDGLCARAGIALFDAGDRARAARALDRVLRGERPSEPKPIARRGVEGPAARLAARLQLLLRVRPADAARAATVGELLALQQGGRFGTTHDTARAVLALGADASASNAGAADGPIVVDVTTADGAHRSVTLSDGNAHCAVVPLGDAASVRIDAPAGRGVRAVLEATVRTRGSSHAATAEPIAVLRSLVVGTGGNPRDLAQPGASVPRLTPLRIALRIATPRDLDYVVVDCPLPAGFEVAGAPPGWEIHDDRAVRLLPRLGAGESVELSLPVVAAACGDVAWPPVTVSAMYSADAHGASQGGRLRIVDTAAGTATASAPALGRACLDARLDELRQRVDAAAEDGERSRAVDELGSVCGDVGRSAVLDLAAATLARLDVGDGTLRAVARVVAPLPAAGSRTQQWLGDPTRPDRLAALLLAAAPDRFTDDPGFAAARAALCGDADQADLGSDFRAQLLRCFADELLLQPFRTAVERASMRDGVAHTAGPEVPTEVTALGALVRAAARLRARAPFDPDDVRAWLTSWRPAPSGAADAPAIGFATAVGGDVARIFAAAWILGDGPAPVASDSVLALAGLAARVDDRDARVRAFRTLLATAPHDDARTWCIRVLIAALPEDDADLRAALEPDLLALLRPSEPAQARAEAWRALRTATRSALAPSTIVDALASGRLSERDLHGIAATRQADVLLEALRRDPVPRLDADFAVACLGAERIARLPLDRLAPLACDRLVDALVARDVAQLEAAFRRARDGAWRRCLTRVVLRREARIELPPAPADDAAGPLYADVVAARRGDAAARARVAALLREAATALASERPDERRGALPADVRRLLAQALLPELPLATFAAHADALSPAEQRDYVATLDERSLAEFADLSLGPAVRGTCVERALQLGRPELALRCIAAEHEPSLRIALALAMASDPAGLAALREAALDPDRGDAAARASFAAGTHAFTGRPTAWLDEDGERRTLGRPLLGRILQVEGLEPEVLAEHGAEVARVLRWRGIAMPAGPL
ncbi:MAG: hypothetical protein IPM29_09915 [Planctomycetes bacterium]|nr:hypothetical protein [Planctomycetota bacterium]